MNRVMAKLGSEEARKATRFLRFDFAVEREGKTLVRRAHTWDRSTGRYRKDVGFDQVVRIEEPESLKTPPPGPSSGLQTRDE